MRLFLAIYPSTEILSYCRDVYRQFDKEKRNLRPVPPEQLHLTLRFVGAKVSDQSKNILIQELKALSGTLARPEIVITGLKFGFARQHDPRVLFAEVAARSELLALQEQINRLIRSLDFADTITWKSHRDKDFHISIARLKPAATRSSGRDVKAILGQISTPLPPAQLVDQIHVVQSILDSRGQPSYRILDQIKL